MGQKVVCHTQVRLVSSIISCRLNMLTITPLKFVLRPYIYIYANHSETDEHGVINLAAVRIDHQNDIEELLQVKSICSLFLCHVHLKKRKLSYKHVMFSFSVPTYLRCTPTIMRT